MASGGEGEGEWTARLILKKKLGHVVALGCGRDRIWPWVSPAGGGPDLEHPSAALEGALEDSRAGSVLLALRIRCPLNGAFTRAVGWGETWGGVHSRAEKGQCSCAPSHRPAGKGGPWLVRGDAGFRTGRGGSLPALHKGQLGIGSLSGSLELPSVVDAGSLGDRPPRQPSGPEGLASFLGGGILHRLSQSVAGALGVSRVTSPGEAVRSLCLVSPVFAPHASSLCWPALSLSTAMNHGCE